MSINSAVLAGVSGLVANSSALAAISDNIANVNTTSYKRNGVTFSDAVTSQAVAGRYSAGGVSGVVQHFISQQGLIQSSTSNTDLAISGDGMFVVTDKATGLTASDSRLFTRAGSFTPIRAYASRRATNVLPTPGAPCRITFFFRTSAARTCFN